MITQAEFVNFHLSKFGYTSKQDLIENLYLKAILDSYQRIDKKIAIENDIRDRFIKDFYTHNGFIKNWLQLKILHVNWERWIFTEGDELGRADLSFELSGLDFIVECKRLKNVDKKYFENGLNRFIELKYAKGDEYAGMIGFIISTKKTELHPEFKKMSENYNHTKTKFSSDILKLWEESFQSSHIRSDTSVIDIYHLFLNFKDS